jgi:hypothetical protein
MINPHGAKIYCDDCTEISKRERAKAGYVRRTHKAKTAE